MGFLPFQAKEAILEMDSYCKFTLPARFVPHGAHLLDCILGESTEQGGWGRLLL